jgi:hypothetical protein
VCKAYMLLNYGLETLVDLSADIIYIPIS